MKQNVRELQFGTSRGFVPSIETEEGEFVNLEEVQRLIAAQGLHKLEVFGRLKPVLQVIPRPDMERDFHLVEL